MNNFVFRARYFMFIRYAAFHLQQLSAKRQRKTSEQKAIEVNKDSDKIEAAKETEKGTKRDTKSQEKEVKRDSKSQEKETKVDSKSQDKEHKDKKQKKEEKKEKLDTAKKEDSKDSDKIEKIEIKEKDDEMLLNENYSEIDTDVAKKIVESITDSICSGDKQESDCK